MTDIHEFVYAGASYMCILHKIYGQGRGTLRKIIALQWI